MTEFAKDNGIIFLQPLFSYLLNTFRHLKNSFFFSTSFYLSLRLKFILINPIFSKSIFLIIEIIIILFKSIKYLKNLKNISNLVNIIFGEEY